MTDYLQIYLLQEYTMMVLCPNFRWRQIFQKEDEDESAGSAVQCGGNNTGDGGGGACLVLVSSVGTAISGKCRRERSGAGTIMGSQHQLSYYGCFV